MNPPDQPTPRTDAVEFFDQSWFVSADFARTLERELAASNKRIADCEFLLEHRYKIIQQQEPRCNEAIARAEKAEAALHALRLVCGTSDADKFTTWLNVAIARAEKAEAERDRAEAEVAAFKKVLLEFGQSTPP
jgi:prophage antirepressor-like protein